VLQAKQNPFALIALTCQKALLESKIPDQELGEQRLTIAKALLRHNYEPDRIISFMLFLKNFIFIDNEEINLIFDQQIEALTGGKINMGIIETIKMQERREGKLEGKLEGRHEEAIEIAKNFKDLGVSIADIAKGTGLTIEEIKKL
jgi:predicted transposase/invertase (TIGR01784 family)